MQTKKTTSTHHASHKKDVEEEVVHSPEQKPMMKLNNWQAGLVILVVLAAALYYFKGMFVVATVNGKPIFRTTYNTELERMAGQRALDSVITTTLIDQESQKHKITVSQKEIDNEIAKLKTNLSNQGQNLDDILKAQNISNDVLKEQMRIQIMLKKLLSKDIKVTDKEIEDFAAANKDSMPQAGMSPQVKENIKEQITQQKLNEKYATWIADLKAKSKINTYIKM